jgi:hypothetical protein
MSYFDELDKGHEQTKTSKDWAIFRKGLEKTLFKSMKTRRTEAKIKAVKYMDWSIIIQQWNFTM